MLDVAHDGEVTRIVFNRPDADNRFTTEMLDELMDLLQGRLRDQRLVVLRGAGGMFSAGLAGRGAPPAEAYDFRTGFDPLFELHEAFRRCPAVMLGVVEGKAVGFGITLVAVCDIVIAAETARFALPETAHGILPTAGLSRMIGTVPDKLLAYFAVSAEEFTADEAFAAGLVSRVALAKSLEADVEAIVANATRMPKAVLRGIKEYIAASPNAPDASRLSYARNLHAIVNSYSGNRPPRS